LRPSYSDASELETANYIPPEGYVPNAKTAISITMIVAEPIYGRRVLQGEKPFTATLEKDVWIVRGTLKKGYKGGTLECRISKQTGQITRMIHWK
jgi:hypothetical protein